MTFQIPQNPAAQGAAGMPAGDQLLRIQALEKLTQSLEVGAYLKLLVQSDQSGNPGVLYRGQFLPASLPPGLSNGQQISVRILSNIDTLILQLVDRDRTKHSSKGVESPQKSVIHELIEKLLGEGAIKDLKLSASSLQEASNLPLPLRPGAAESNASAMLRAPNPLLPQENQNQELSPLLREASKLLKRLVENHHLLSEQQIEQAPTLYEKLKQLLVPRASEQLPQIQNLLKLVTRERGEASQHDFIGKLKHHIDALLAGNQDLSAAPASAAQQSTQLAEQLRIYTASSAMLIAQSDSRGLEQLARQISRVEEKDSPLLLLIKTLGLFEFSNVEDAPNSHSEIVQTIKNFLHELRALRDTRAADKDVRAVLQRFSAALSQDKPTSLQLKESVGTLDLAAGTLRSLERVLSSKQSLTEASTLLYALGQPALFIIPAIIDGTFLNWKLTLSNPPARSKVQDEDKQKRGDKGGAYEKVEFDLSLPALGPIQVVLARNGEELMLQLGMQSEELCAFIAAKFEALRQRLKAAGAEKIEINAKLSASRLDLPEWYSEVIKSSIIA